MERMHIYTATDHRGFQLAQKLYEWMKKIGVEIVDIGPKTLDPNDDFVPYAHAVAQAVQKETGSKGIVLCGSGVGVDIEANKTEGIRSGLGFSEEQVKAAREDDDINVLALPSDFVSFEKAQALITAFLQTPFKNEEKYVKRISEIQELERR